MEAFQSMYQNVAWALLGIVSAIVLVLLLLAWRNPVLFKLGLRNIPRRPAQSILIVIGLTLSTVIIVASFATGDTLNYSVRRQAVAAYGEIDEIIAPPLLSAFASFGAGTEATAETEEQLQSLTAGGLESVLALIDGGLPGISTDRLAQLKEEAEAEPLIDGVSGTILFPTIIRNTTTGQGEPIGFIFAVDDDFDRQFGLNSIDGEALEVENLTPGVGNIFLQASNLFSLVGDLGERLGINLSVSNIATAVAAIGAVASGAQDGDLMNMSIDVETLQSLGIDTTALEEAEVTDVTVGELVANVPGLTGLVEAASQSLAPMLEGGAPVTATVEPGAAVALSATVPITATVPATAAGGETATMAGSLVSGATGALGGLVQQGSELLSSFNLATLGSELDRVLGQVGLQLRQGDVYLNRLGAERLGAQPGDVLELFVGPIPVPFRVREVVEEASPVGALLPVVVMRLDEAQKLFFMSGKVNNVLVSNQGDMLEGVEYTTPVSDRLRVLAMDPAALEEAFALLRQPQVREPLQAAAAEGVQGMLGEDVPPFLANLLGSVVDLEGQAERYRQLATGLDQPELNDDVRTALGNTEVRSWLLNQDIPRSDRDALSAVMADLNEFDVIDPLNKETVLLASNIGGTVFSSMFSVFGFFSVVAGILLIFLIYVMLAAERRSEMGIARAIGVQRGHVVQMFVSEGMVYSLAAAAVGVLIGLGVSYVLIEYLGSIVNSVAGQFSATSTNILDFTFRASSWSIIISYSLGVLLTFIVVFLSSWRVSRLNIVAAIRDLPDESNATPRSVVWHIGRWTGTLILLALGGLILYYGFRWTVWSVVLIGVTFLLFGVLQVVGRLLELLRLRGETASRIVYTLIGLGLLGLWITPWQRVLPTLGLEQFAGDPTQLLAVFAIGGPMIITGAIMAIMFNATFFTWLIGLLFGRVGSLAPVLKTAIAYPLSTRFRTGMAMVLFAMIMATVVVMSIVIEATQSLIVLDEQESGGFTIETSNTLLSFFSPLRDLDENIERETARYPLLSEVEHVGAVTTAQLDATMAGEPGTPTTGEPGAIQAVAMTQGYIAQVSNVYGFTRRADGFADDAAVWEALRTRDDVVIVRPRLLEGARGPGGPPSEMMMEMDEAGLEQGAWIPFSITGAGTGETLPPLYIELKSWNNGDSLTKRVQVIGVLESGDMHREELLQMNVATLDALLDEPPQPSNFYLTVKPGADVHEVAMEVERAFLPNGINATVMAERFAQGQSLTRNILTLLQGFMALGLLVGIAGLGVITTRTVVERRQQVGMLRAIGYQANAVAASFVLEASFIAITGLVIGMLTGMVLGMNIVGVAFGAMSTVTDLTTAVTGAAEAAQPVFHMPWRSILLVLGLAYGFSLLTTLAPAWQASRIYPAEALRYE